MGSFDLAEMGSLSSYDRNIKYVLCAIDVFTKYAWVKPLVNKKDEKVLNESNRKSNESLID